MKIKPLVLTLSIVVLVVIMTGAISTAQSTRQQQEGTDEIVYRESTIQRGDITVGVTENAVATLKIHELSFEIAGEITELPVKAGQPVKEGDLLAVISTDDIQDQIKESKLAYQTAVLNLSEAQLAKQKGELDAQSTYNSTINRSQSADVTYEMTVEKLTQAVRKAEIAVEEIQTEVRTYTTLLRNIEDYDEDYDRYVSTKEWYEDSQEWVSSCEQLITEYKRQHNPLDENDPEYQRLLSNLENAQAELEYSKLEYDDAAKDYDRKYDTDLTDEDDIKDARDDAYSRLTDAEAVLKEAKYNLEIGTPEAALTKDDNLARAELSDITYQMELQALANGVTSRQLALQNIQLEIDDLTAQLEKNTIVSPADGIITSINTVVGTDIQANSTVVTVSDSQNVYVYMAVTQEDITGISMGQSASVVMDAFEDIPFDGTVDGITTTPARNASSTASYNVTIKLEGNTSQVYEGMTGNATLITRQQKNVLYVTNRTVYQNNGKSYVKIRQEDGAIIEVEVKTGFSDGRNVEISGDIREGQTVLIESRVTAQ